MIEWIIENWFLIVALACVLGVVIKDIKDYLFLPKIEREKKIKTFIYNLVEEAEHQITGTKQGKIRLKFVIDKFYKKCPFIFKLLLPKAKLITFIEENVKEMKQYIESSREIQKNK